MIMPSPFAIFTICSNNYMPAARTLLDSVRTHHPEAHLFLCLVDERLDAPDLYDPAWTLIEAASLSIQDFMSFAFRHDIMELNTAVKPFMFQHLLDGLGYQIALYLDPDIEVFRPLDSILGLLRAGASFVLTPICVRRARQRTSRTISRFCALASTIWAFWACRAAPNRAKFWRGGLADCASNASLPWTKVFLSIKSSSTWCRASQLRLTSRMTPA